MLLTVLWMVVVVVLMIGVNALYVAGEFAAVSARKPRIVQAASQGSRLAKMLLPVLEDHHRLDRYIAASQVGITLSSIVLGIYGQQQIAPRIAPLVENLPGLSSQTAAAGLAAVLVLILLTTLQVIFGELVPKSLALLYPEQLALGTALPMRWSADFILRPLIILLNGSGALLLRLLGVRHEAGHRHVHLPEEIQLLIRQSHAGGLLNEEEQRLLDRALRFGEMRIGEIVVPRTRMVAVSRQTPLDEVLRVAAGSDYTRIPVYDGGIDHIAGFVHLKDLFRLYYAGTGQPLDTIVRNATFVPETARVDEVWNTLNREQSYLAIVFDEYGGTLGMVTREDLIEELFGEFQDEFDDEAAPLIRPLGEREFLIQGEAPISHINDHFDLDLPTDLAYTLGGLLPGLLARIPKPGDEAAVGDVRLVAQSMKGMVVREVRLVLPPDAGPPAEGTDA